MKTSAKGWISKLRAWTDTQPRAVLAGVGLGILAGGWLLYGPVFMQIRRLSSERTILKADLQKGQQTLARLREGEVPVLAGIEKAPEVLSQLETLARTFDVRFLEVSPGQSRSPGAEQPVLLPVEIRLEGGYRSLGEFLGSLKNIKQAAVLVRGIRVARDAQWLPRLRAQVSVELGFSQETYGS